MTSTQKNTREKISFPVQYEIVPDKLYVNIFNHDITIGNSTIPCWSYVTKGLKDYNQKEIIFTLKREQNETEQDFPDIPLILFKQIYNFAKERRLVDIGDFTQFKGNEFLGSNALLYVPSESLNDVQMPKISLSAILLADGELDLVKSFGFSRLLTGLGKKYTYYPFPTWSERGRESLPFEGMKNSILLKTRAIQISGIYINKTNDQISLRINVKNRNKLKEIMEQIPADNPIAFLTEIDPIADSCLTWNDDGSQPFAISLPGSSGRCMSGCFILFVPNQPKNIERIIEDGFGILLTSSSWNVLQQALTGGENISIPMNEEKPLFFNIDWFSDTYQSPIDNDIYYAAGGWKTHKPNIATQQELDNKEVKIDQIILLTSDDDLRKRVTVDELAGYIKKLEVVVQEFFEQFIEIKEKYLLLEIEMLPDKIKINMASKPQIEDEILTKLYDKVIVINIPKIIGGPVKFQTIFSIRASGKP
ncbi:MAG: TGF-beta receptor interacting domain-containing protein [Promethearchaeota archaeon]